MTAPAMSFGWWERQEPGVFLAENAGHGSRSVGTWHAIRLAQAGDGSLIEAGPGSGIDYAQAFRAVDGTAIRYQGWEPTARFVAALRQRFPAAMWVHASLYDLPPACADVVYARAVLEHQPALHPALSLLAMAARRYLVLDWYRPPADVASCDMCDDVPCHTFARQAVMDTIAACGMRVLETHAVDGNEVWVVERVVA